MPISSVCSIYLTAICLCFVPFRPKTAVSMVGRYTQSAPLSAQCSVRSRTFSLRSQHKIQPHVPHRSDQRCQSYLHYKQQQWVCVPCVSVSPLIWLTAHRSLSSSRASQSWGDQKATWPSVSRVNVGSVSSGFVLRRRSSEPGVFRGSSSSSWPEISSRQLSQSLTGRGMRRALTPTKKHRDQLARRMSEKSWVSCVSWIVCVFPKGKKREWEHEQKTESINEVFVVLCIRRSKRRVEIEANSNAVGRIHRRRYGSSKEKPPENDREKATEEWMCQQQQQQH